MDTLSAFDVFSRRQAEEPQGLVGVPDTTRNRILLWLGELLREGSYSYGADLGEQFAEEERKRLYFRLGRMPLYPEKYRNPAEEVTDYLLRCPTNEFLDLLEDLFRSASFGQVRRDRNDLVYEVNGILQVDELPFYLTKEVRVPEGYDMRIVAYPKVVLRGSEVLDLEAVDPALNLLADPAYEAANIEFREALTAFRKGDLQKCLTKCTSALESVLKIAISKHGWTCKKMTAGPMVQTLVANTDLEGFFDPMLIVVATLRHKMGGVHGAGTDPQREVPKHWARYAINATAAAILLIVEEAG